MLSKLSCQVSSDVCYILYLQVKFESTTGRNKDIEDGNRSFCITFEMRTTTKGVHMIVIFFIGISW